MIYTEKTMMAMKIAYSAHNGQFDKSGVPYIYHPIHVAEQMTSEDEVIVALLHDTIEDTDVTADYLRQFFDEHIIEAVELLTRDKNTDYFEYIRHLKSNHLARSVKLADLFHNSDETRLLGITDKDKARLEKYKTAIYLLLSCR